MLRRGFIGGLVGLLAAPAIIRTPGLLMPVKRGLASSWKMDGYVVVRGMFTSVTVPNPGPTWGAVASYAEFPAGWTVKRVAEYYYVEEPQWLPTGKGYANGDLITIA